MNYPLFQAKNLRYVGFSANPAQSFWPVFGIEIAYHDQMNQIASRF
jgi:hypothetical protein